MSDIDNALRRGLSADDEAFLKRLDEQGMFAQMSATFQGPMRLWTWFAFAMTFAFFALFLYAGWQALTAEAVRETLLWSVGALWFSLAIAMLKLWLWERMNHLAMLRELKKLELKIAQLQEEK
jgi:hypothetical protein